MKKLLIAILAVAALANANVCEDIAEISMNRLLNCKLDQNDDNDVRFRCSNGTVGIHDKNKSTRYLTVLTDFNKNTEPEVMIIHFSDCVIMATDEYGVADRKFASDDIDSGTMMRLWNYFKRYKVR